MPGDRETSMQIIQSRRKFLATVSAAGAARLLGSRHTLAGEGSLETTAIRLVRTSGICVAPIYIAEDLLRAEGFTDIHYVSAPGGVTSAQATTRGEADFLLTFAAPLLMPMDAGEPLTVIAGAHVGCFELFANDSIRTISDLKGKSVGVQAIGSSQHVFLASMATYVGLDPNGDIAWVTSPSVKPKELFVEGEIDAFLGFPPEPQEMRARNIGHVVVNSALDHPWSQYFCCMVAGNTDFVREHPVATKRVLRAILKAIDFCAADPEGAARRLVDRGFTPRYDYALQTLTDLPYDRWREYDPEDTLRFYALRLHEAGMIASTPNQLIAAGTDWRFLNELKRELKA
jgi:NitT/TauT family transport system substrate-binding protein